ncbi:MAG: MATE family efflux transporter [Clostridia bacterium]|nr:MATE family efflux transporter [Clostridia bacterium]
MASGRNTIDMTEGSIWRHLVGFAAPMLIGLLFQQLYNTVDSLVVGNYVSKQALGAVGSTGVIINTLVGFFSGLSTGAGVVIARAFGAHDRNAVHRAVHTTMAATLVLCVILTTVATLLIPPLLGLMKMPEDMYGEALTYLEIYFWGVSGMMLYNMGAGILRAVGDSRRPLYFLVFSAIVNTIGDLIFVLVFKMGVAGVAWATVLSQALSAILVLYVLMKTDDSYKLQPAKLRFHGSTLKMIIRFGLPTAFQTGITSFSNVFVQGYINVFGTECAAGWTIYGKLDQFTMLPLQGLSMANSTFVGQNLGAGNIERAKRGVRTTLLLAISSTLVLMLPLLVFRRELLSMFNSDPGVLDFGQMFVLWITPFYVFCCVNDTLGGSLRGAGEATASMACCLGSFVVSRQIYLYVVSLFTHDALVTGMGYPLGWVLCSIAMTLCWKLIPWEKKQAALRQSV